MLEAKIKQGEPFSTLLIGVLTTDSNREGGTLTDMPIDQLVAFFLLALLMGLWRSRSSHKRWYDYRLP